jgi:hypothetical protein
MTNAHVRKLRQAPLVSILMHVLTVFAKVNHSLLTISYIEKNL